MDDENHIRLWQNVPTLSQLNTFAIRKYTNPLENVYDHDVLELPMKCIFIVYPMIYNKKN